MLIRKKTDTKTEVTMAGAPNISPRIARWGLLSIASALVALIGCDPSTIMDSTEPGALETYFSGCHTVYEGPVCEVPAASPDQESVLTFWVAGQTAPVIEFTTARETQRLEPEFKTVGQGLRFSLSAPAQSGTYRFQANGPVHQTWQLDVQLFTPRDSTLENAYGLRKDKDHKTVKSLLEENLHRFSPRDRGEALSLLGRTELSLQNPEAAILRLEEAKEAHQIAGNLSAPIRDLTAYTYTNLFRLGLRFEQTRQHLQEFVGHLPGHYESQHFYHWSQARLAEKANEHRNAFRYADRGTWLAQAMGNQRFEHYMLQLKSHALLNLNLFGDAAEALSDRVSRINDESPTCEDAENLNSLGWAELLERESALNDAATMGIVHNNIKDPQPYFERALKISSDTDICPVGSSEDINSLLNLALLALTKNDLITTSELVITLGQKDSMQRYHTFWYELIQARLAKSQNHASRALNHYSRLEKMLETNPDPYLLWLSLVEKAETLNDVGQRKAAQQLWERASSYAQNESLQIPIHTGRASFLSYRQKATQAHVASLLATGEAPKALSLIRHSRVQVLKSLQWNTRVSNMTDAQKGLWDIAMATYQRTRKKIQELKKNAWALSHEELKQAHAEIKKLEIEASQSLDRSYSILDMSRVHWSPTSSEQKPKSGQLYLTYFKLKQGWIGIIQTTNEIRYRHLGEIQEDATPVQLANALLKPFQNSIVEAAEIYIQPWGKLRRVDFHALPLNGQALITYAPVVYSLSIDSSTETEKPEPRQVLIVSDPSGNLPMARAEAEALNKVVEQDSTLGVSILRTEEATSQAVRDQIVQADIFHYAGHGQFNPNTIQDSALKLANETQLTVGDILALPRAPTHVILSACESAKSNQAFPLEGLGLAQAFALAGSQTIIASTRPVDDRLSEYLASQIYQSYQTNKNFSLALQKAQQEAAITFPDADWSTFRMITPR